jgi:hypothetical protein
VITATRRRKEFRVLQQAIVEGHVCVTTDIRLKCQSIKAALQSTGARNPRLAGPILWRQYVPLLGWLDMDGCRGNRKSLRRSKQRIKL